MESVLAHSHKRINILDLRDSPWVDGPGRTILDCARSIEGDRFHFVIGGFSGGEQNTNAYTAEAKDRGLEVVSIPEKSAFDWSVIKSILKVIDENEIDLIHTHDFRSNIFGLICSILRRKPIISTAHGWIANNLKGRVYRIADKLILRMFDHVIAVSDRTRGLLTRALISERKTSVLRNALIIENYVDTKHKSLHQELEIDEDVLLIGNIGRLSPEKGQLEFLKVAKEIVKTNTKVKFLLVGIGSDEEMLRAFVSENNLDEFVIFSGFRRDMVNIYSDLDLVVQSSYTEGMPNVMLEALLMAVPVIATDVGGTSEIVVNNQTGVLVNPGSIGMLVDAVNRFLDDRAAFAKMADSGSDLIKSNFNHTKRVEKLTNLYCTLTES